MANGFKEWQVVCDALASGRQSLILRKGGIHEGRAGFSFAEESFFLFPTRFHNQDQFVREGRVELLPEWVPGETVRITHWCEASWARTLNDWEQVAALAPFHVWTEDTIRQRFDWEGKGMSAGSIHVALVRVFKLAEPWEFAYEAKYGGCRSWVALPEPSSDLLDQAAPVMGEEAFASLALELGRMV
ncbi:MAG: DUF1802 family protein [Verrucomicrobia bacterium]|nr:MAG: DUF1802 family protein [Verrucomicrobiota bacterium]TAE87882.1 MAG: DUF1802 family protein [Verrucomicrobiota bacterium]TAF25625.1 MAG: DUF1802 family protein [Verrucomicrobiota bacterium]TAF41309.1 MAG: DUF1802 family protein [Verrucomicrobiota bacterium]